MAHRPGDTQNQNRWFLIVLLGLCACVAASMVKSVAEPAPKELDSGDETPTPDLRQESEPSARYSSAR